MPQGNIIIKPAPFTHKALLQTLSHIASLGPGKPFSGYLAISNSEKLFLLFFFNGQPYAAGVSVGEKPASLTITNFCAQIASITDGSCRISLHETDPVLLKSLLIFIQDEPTAKAPARLINLEEVARQIRDEAADALIILESASKFNLFFFKGGVTGKAYWAEDIENQTRDDLDIGDQMLLYAFQDTNGSVDALVYRNIATMESRDSSSMTLDGLINLFGGKQEFNETVANIHPQQETSMALVLKVIDGPQAGSTLTGAIPSVLGRKDADILIFDPMVSKRHATIQMINGKLVVIDLNSTNGTTLNGEPVGQRELKPGDRIGIGQTTLSLEQVNL